MTIRRPLLVAALAWPFAAANAAVGLMVAGVEQASPWPVLLAALAGVASLPIVAVGVAERLRTRHAGRGVAWAVAAITSYFVYYGAIMFAALGMVCLRTLIGATP